MARFQVLACSLMLVALLAPMLSAPVVPAANAAASRTVWPEAVERSILWDGCGLDCLPYPLSVLREGVAAAIPAPDADGDALDDFWLVQYRASAAPGLARASLHSSATGSMLREVSAPGAFMFPVITLGADPHWRTLTGIGSGPAMSLFWVYYDPVTDDCNVLPFPYYSIRLVAIDDGTGAVLWSREYPRTSQSYVHAGVRGPHSFLPGDQILIEETTTAATDCGEGQVVDVGAVLLDLYSGEVLWQEPLNAGFGVFNIGSAWGRVDVLPAAGAPRLVTLSDDDGERRIEVRSGADFTLLFTRGEEELGVRPDVVEASVGPDGILLVRTATGTTAAAMHVDGGVLWRREQPGGLPGSESLGLDGDGNGLFLLSRDLGDGPEDYVLRVSDGGELWSRAYDHWAYPEPSVGDFVLCNFHGRRMTWSLDLDGDGISDWRSADGRTCREYRWVVPNLVRAEVHRLHETRVTIISGGSGQVLHAEVMPHRALDPWTFWGQPTARAGLVPFVETPGLAADDLPPDSLHEWVAFTTFDPINAEWRRTVLQDRTYLTQARLADRTYDLAHDGHAYLLPIMAPDGGIAHYLLHWAREDYPAWFSFTAGVGRSTTTAIDPVTHEVLWQLASDHLDIDWNELP